MAFNIELNSTNISIAYNFKVVRVLEPVSKQTGAGNLLST